MSEGQREGRVTKIRYMLDQEDDGRHKLVYIEDEERRALAHFEMDPKARNALIFLVDIANEGLRGRDFDTSPDYTAKDDA